MARAASLMTLACGSARRNCVNNAMPRTFTRQSVCTAFMQPQPRKQQQSHLVRTNGYSYRLFSSSPASSNESKEQQHNNKRRLSPRQKIIDHFEKQAETETNEIMVIAQRNALIDTLDWLEHVVIGYNLCPFAEAPMLRDELSIQVVLGQDEREILAQVLGECKRLQRNQGTALIVCPDLAPNNFLQFLETYNIMVEGVLPDQELQDDLQIAPFHPLFVFGNDDDDDDDDENDVDNNSNTDLDSNLHLDSIDNYTNRSPYPTFHVLREAEVEKAVDVLEGNAETVWKRNVDLLEAMEDLFDENESNENNDNEQQSATLLRSVFLKGKANRLLDDENNNSTSKSSCPMETVQGFQKQIRALLKEFRKKDYS